MGEQIEFEGQERTYPMQPVPDQPGESVPKNPRGRHIAWATVSATLVISALLILTGRLDSFARNLLERFNMESPAPVTEVADTVLDSEEVTTYQFSELEIHPDVLFRPYTAGPALAEAGSARFDRIQQFRALLDLYRERQGVDDNFTIRVVDERSGDVLELFVLESEKALYDPESDIQWDWGRIDRLRRDRTRELVDKWAARGVPRKAVTVKWGRADQVREARTRDLPFIEYEIRLARYLGLSLLSTEIGTVETFNQDRLVSPVGARSRYQMMPYLLRQNGIHHYSLATAAGNSVSVFEEWHPLLTMEPSLLTLRGYASSVGHEIPGISAYHTGPGNIYRLFRLFLTNESDALSPASSVVDAYMWGVTDGFPVVSARSSFGSHSRGYVASGYGALRAVEDQPIDRTKTLLAERVQLKPGRSIYLNQLLDELEKVENNLIWGGLTEDDGYYTRFRRLNQHISLPASEDSAGVPVAGNVRLVDESGDVPVRFFLPLGATDALLKAGVDLIDPESVFRFDHNTFAPPSPAEKTEWDREYDRLVEDIGRFGFSVENRTHLRRLVDRFIELERENPSHYRQAQLQIIKTHSMLWGSDAFNDLANAVASVRGRLRAPTEPPVPLPAGSTGS